MSIPCPRLQPGSVAAERLQRVARHRRSWLAAGAVGLILCVTGGDRVGAAPVGGSKNALRFFESLAPKKDEPPRAFIEVPLPPSAEEVEAAAKAGPSGTSSAKQKPRPVTTSRGIKDVKATPPRLPTLAEATAFGSGLAQVAERVVTDAANPHYERKQPVPETVVVAPSPKSRRKTPAIVATRLTPTGMPAPQTARFERLRTRIARTLATYQRRPLNTAENTPWEVMHGFIAFGIPTQVRVGGPAGDLVNAIGWSNMGGRCKGQVMLAATGDRLVALKGMGVQGHSAQYLAILAQCRVAASSPITVQGKQFTVTDLIEEEKLACRSKTELTFALISLAHYLPTDATWTSRDGQEWSLERLVEEEIVQPIRGAPCGGTHRLFGLSYGCQRRLRATGQLDGAYLRADKYVRDYQAFTLAKLQNRDGSFSTEWFKYPANRDDDVDRKIQTTGHILEWLVSSLDQEKLYDPRVVAAAEFLANALAREPSREWKIGPLGHALHALNIYQERAWGVVLPGGIAAFHGPMKTSAAESLVAKQPESKSRSGGKPVRR